MRPDDFFDPYFSVVDRARSLSDSEDLGPGAGASFDHQLGKFNALHGLQKKISRDELLARANTIQIYCGLNAARAYCQELEDVGISTPYEFDGDGNERVDRDHEGMKYLAVMDIYEMGETGAMLGWKPQWCPFRGPAETLWHAGFNGEKSNPIVQRRRQEIRDHETKARKAIRSRALPFGGDGEPIRSGDPDAIEKIEGKIAALSETIDSAKAANKIIRRMEKAGAEESEILKAVMAETSTPANIAARAIVLQPWQNRRGYDTTGDRAEIRRLKGRLETLQRTKPCGTVSQTVQAPEAAFEVKENADVARLQLIFPGKPDAETRALLKATAFAGRPAKLHGNAI